MTEPSYDNLPPLREVITRYGLSAKKSLGQHFLCDLNLTKKIVLSAGDLKNLTVFEIGPGPGGLTRSLLASNAKKVIAIEKDARCLDALQELVQTAEGKLELVHEDALKIDLTSLCEGPCAVVANLPYNIATELLLGWLHRIEGFKSLTLMFQSEVVDRLVSPPHSKNYGRLSVITQFCCQAKRVMDIPARAFTPPPKVNSSVINLTPRPNRPLDISLEKLENLTKHAFGQRRKMLRSSLKTLGGESLLLKANIDPERRAEQLSLEEFEALSRCF